MYVSVLDQLFYSDTSFIYDAYCQTSIYKCSLEVQWLRLCTSNAGGMSSIPGWGTGIPHAVLHSQKKQNLLSQY